MTAALCVCARSIKRERALKRVAKRAPILKSKQCVRRDDLRLQSSQHSSSSSSRTVAVGRSKARARERERERERCKCCLISVSLDHHRVSSLASTHSLGTLGATSSSAPCFDSPDCLQNGSARQEIDCFVCRKHGDLDNQQQATSNKQQRLKTSRANEQDQQQQRNSNERVTGNRVRTQHQKPQQPQLQRE